MADSAGNVAETTLDQRFAKNLLRYVLHEYMLGLNWTPTGIFAEKAVDSPFTKEFRDAVRNELEKHGPGFHESYDLYFPDKTEVEEYHFTVCKAKKDYFQQIAFTKDDFITFCAILAQFAGLSYLYGAESAPYDTFMLLVTALRELRQQGKLDDKFWSEMQNWLENGKCESTK